MNLDSIEILKETDPASFWQSSHYIGWEGVLIRYASPNEERVREVTAHARDFVAAKPPVKPRKRKWFLPAGAAREEVGSHATLQ